MVDDIQAHRETDFHLIVEMESDESLLNMIAPTIKIKKTVAVLKTKHIQIARFVYTATVEQDTFFEGKKTSGLPSVGELFIEFFKPGTQITYKDTGNWSTMLTYVGKKNILKAEAPAIVVGCA